MNERQKELSELNPKLSHALKEWVKIIQEYKYQRQPKVPPETKEEKKLFSLYALSNAIFNFASDINLALENDHTYTACSLACLLLEAEIYFIHIELFPSAGVDFYDFGIVEDLKRLKFSPEEEELFIQRLEKNNCQRFLKEKDLDLLKRESYKKYWYKCRKSGIKDISTANCNKIIKREGKNPALADNMPYKNYQALCGFKHYSPYYIGISFKTMTDKNDMNIVNFKYSAIISTLSSLHQVCVVLNSLYGEKIPNIKGWEEIYSILYQKK